MRIAQISDLHLGRRRAGASPAEIAGEIGLNLATLHTLDATLAELRAQRFDLVAFTGDLLDVSRRRPNREALRFEGYQRLRWRLDVCGLPYCVLPGNNDNAAMMRHVWPEPPFDEVVDGWRVMAFWDELDDQREAFRPSAEMARFAAALADPRPQVQLQHYLTRPECPPHTPNRLRGYAEMAAKLAGASHPTVIVSGHHHDPLPTTVEGAATYVNGPAYGVTPFAWRALTIDEQGARFEDNSAANDKGRLA